MSEFSGKLQHQAWMIAPETQKVMSALLENGGDARFVGGCIRNALSNRDVIDIDIATPLKPEEVIERLKAHKIACVPIGLKHGTVTAIIDGHPFEITTLRRDVATFGRHADVQFTDSWKTDAARRDFTFNAIFATVEGDLYDPFGGIEDLRNGIVRFVGDPATRIEEDVLRILRFFRFYAHFGRSAPDPAAIKACAAAAGSIARLSAERIRQEVLKLLESGHCAATWQLMSECGVTTHFLPEATNIPALERLISLEARMHEEHPFPLRRLAAVLNVTLKGLPDIVKALKLSNDQAAQLGRMMDTPPSMNLAPSDVRKMVFRLGNETARNLLLLTAARVNDASQLAKFYKEATDFSAPVFPLRGDDVLGTGIRPGPEVGRLLESVINWWIDQDFKPDRAACLEKLTGSKSA